MNYTLECEWITTAGLPAACVRHRLGHRCGYVGVPKWHPLHGCGYSEPSKFLHAPGPDEPTGKRGVLSVFCLAGNPERMRAPEAVFNVHGSLTYARGHSDYPVNSDGVWWFGFDCGHAGDDNLSQEYVVAECESLATQIVEKTLATESA